MAQPPLFNVKEFRETVASLRNLEGQPAVPEELDEPVDISAEPVYLPNADEEFNEKVEEFIPQLREYQLENPANEKAAQTTLLPELLRTMRTEAELKEANVEGNKLVSSLGATGAVVPHRRPVINYISKHMNQSFPGPLSPLDMPPRELMEQEPDPTPVPADETVLSIALYHPLRPKKVLEFLTLGSQTLKQVRDRFYCLADHILEGPQRQSSFFFIENKFYNDMTNPNNVENSALIMEWVEKNPEEDLPKATVAQMEDTRWDDISVRVGAPYLWVHQGCCEHIVVVTELRMCHPTDPQTIGKYPLLIHQAKWRRRKCDICSVLPARYVTYGDKIAPSHPCFFCDTCYRLFHYTRDGKLLYKEFAVYPYYHE